MRIYSHCADKSAPTPYTSRYPSKLHWRTTSKNDLRDFPDGARRDSGVELYQVQMGLEPSDWKPMPSIGTGVREIRVRAGGAFRVIYLATRPEGTYVLHCFQKKTPKTTPRDIDLARQRYQHIGE